MRSACCISLGAGPRLPAAACGSPISSSTLPQRARQQRQRRHRHAPLPQFVGVHRGLRHPHRLRQLHVGDLTALAQLGVGADRPCSRGPAQGEVA